MKNLYLAQINYSFGDNAFLPYSSGLLWSYIAADTTLSSSFRLADIFCRRLPIEDTLSQIESPDVFGFSCYMWNWNYNLRLTQLVKRKWPNCIIIFGGPEVPNNSEGFFLDHPEINFLVHGEGEETLKELLLNLLIGDKFDKIPGISFPDTNGKTVKTSSRERMANINAIPSPYLFGVFDKIISANSRISWHASQETHRGCPYSCTFCDWGSAVYTKIRDFETSRLIEEINWFGKNKIELLYNCDANYGVLKRDVDLTKSMVETKDIFGFPKKFRAAYAKKSDNKVFEISKLLNEAEMSKGVTLSLQSLNVDTLKEIKRNNISMLHFGELMKKYHKADIPTYTEIILGLPDETLSTFSLGLEAILCAGQHDGLNVYPCIVLKNSELADQDSIAKHCLKTVKIPIGNNHGMIDADGISEFQNIVVSTKSMQCNDWKRAYMLSWIVQTLHCFGLTQLIAMVYHHKYFSYIEFYEKLLDKFAGTQTVLGKEIYGISEIIDSVLASEAGFDRYHSELGEIFWPPEEYSFLQIINSKSLFFNEMYSFIVDLFGKNLAADLIEFQKFMVFDHNMTEAVEIENSFDLFSFYQNYLNENSSSLENLKTKTRFSATNYYAGDIKKFGREIVWYGRKQSLFRTKIEAVQNKLFNGLSDQGFLDAQIN